MTSKKLSIRVIVFGIALLATSQSSYALATESDFKALYDSHQWFRLRQAVNQRNAPIFYKGAVEAVFNKTALAQEHLKMAIASAPNSEQAYRARDLLTSLYLRLGKYRAAFLQNEQMLKIRPNAADSMELHRLLTGLSAFPDQVVTKRFPSKVRGRMLNGNIFMPVQIGSKKAEYIVDTAASFSTMSESEAMRLGLKVHEANATAETVTGRQLGVRIALADLSVGSFHLANVAFLIAPDDQPPFADLPAGQKGIIGLPVLLAFQTVRWRQNGTIEVAFSGHKNLTEPNLCFEDIGLIAQATIQQHQIDVVLDTGATRSQLWPLFAKAFPEIVRQGKRDSVVITGMAGPSQYPVVLVPDMKLVIGGKIVLLNPAMIFLQQDHDLAGWYQGDAGADILGPPNGLTMDFRSMSLVLQ